MQAAVGIGQAFDGGDVGTLHLRGQHIARFDGTSIGNNRTGAALCGIAAHMGTGKAQIFADELHQKRSEEHTSELQSLMRSSYAVFCLKKTNHETPSTTTSKKHRRHNT